MAKKTDEAVKDLAKEVKKLRKENEKLGKSLNKSRADQAEAHREILALLRERPAATDVGADAEEYRGILDEDPDTAAETAEGEDGTDPEDRRDAQDDREEREVTAAARRRADELGVDPTDVEGTGSDGRVLVKDVEAAAGR